MNLAEALHISPEQKSELTEHLIAYLQYLDRNDSLTSDPSLLANWWFDCVVKPNWIEKKIENDLNFVAQIVLFFEKYINELHLYDESNVPIRLTGKVRRHPAFEIYESLSKTKGLSPKKMPSVKEAFAALNLIFSPNNDGNVFEGIEWC